MSATSLTVGACILLIVAGLWWFAWSEVLRWLRVLWVCRIAALSGGLSLLLFTAIEPARDILLESRPGSTTTYWTGFFLCLTAWAMIAHFAARKALEQQAWAARGAKIPLEEIRLLELRSRYAKAAAWVPRLLGGFCFLTVAIAIWGASKDAARLTEPLNVHDPRWLLVPTAVCFVLYAGYVIFRRRFVSRMAGSEPLGDYLRDQFAGSDAHLLTESRAFWFFGLASSDARAARGPRWRWDASAIALQVLLVIVWVATIIRPLEMAHAMPRAIFIVVMLGLPIPLLSFLSVLSHQWRLPVVTLIAIGLSIATGLTTRFHDLRVERGDTAPNQTRLDDAIQAWMAANCPSAAGVAASCQERPIIMAAAGGGSRAAFFTAAVAGELLADPEVKLASRLFAISGVSGGSVAAVMIKAALTVSESGKQPCKKLSGTWWGPYDEIKATDITWKYCLESAASGDFLSPLFVGFAFRDLFGFLGRHDRAFLLETAFEHHFAKYMQAKSAGLSAATGGPVGGSDSWLPLLVLNTTSVVTGRRALISDLAVAGAVFPGTERPLFPVTSDIVQLAGRPDLEGKPGLIRLSTAATASARFPYLTPQASLRVRVDAPTGEDGLPRPPVMQVVDELVDGGYFENDGLTTAGDLAKALQARGLRPIILHVTNAPTAEPGSERPAAQPPWYEGYVAPLRALFDTRDGHAAEALFRLRQDLPDTFTFSVYRHVPVLPPGQACGLLQAGVVHTKALGVSDLAMSWWLSGAVQEYLDRQLCHPLNVRQACGLRARLTGASDQACLAN